jgi:hypothetical protein
MPRRLFFVCISLVCLLSGLVICPQNASADTPPGYTKTWDGGALDGKWESEANWNPDGVPSAQDTIYIGPEFSVLISSQSWTINRLQCDGHLVVDRPLQAGPPAPNLTITDTAVFANDLMLGNCGFLKGPGTIVGNIHHVVGPSSLQISDNLNVVGNFFSNSSGPPSFNDTINVSGDVEVYCVYNINFNGVLNARRVQVGGALNFRIGGPTPGPRSDQYAQINTTLGTTFVGSTFWRLTVGYPAADGDIFQVITGPYFGEIRTRVGMQYVNGIDLGNGLSMEAILSDPSFFGARVVRPYLTSLSPTAIKAGGGDFILTAKGLHLPIGSTLHWRDQSNIVDLGTQYIPGNGPDFLHNYVTLSATIPAALIANPKTIEIYSTNPLTAESDPLPFFITSTGAGITGYGTGSNSNPAGTATASINIPPPAGYGSLTATATGKGTIAVVQYQSDPVGDPFFMSADSYFDVYASQGNSFTSVKIVANNLNGGTVLYWRNGTDWTAVSGQTFDPVSKSITFTVTASTSPNLADLHGLIFGVSHAHPDVGSISTNPLSPIAIGTPISLSASYTCPLGADGAPYLFSVDWDDQTPRSTSDAIGSGSITLNHTYSSAGVYMPKVTVSDKLGVPGRSVFQYVVVYDPSAGFATGGGWINSPAGAYVPNPSLAGKATFGFESKYQNGANLPTGITEFQFHAASMNFSSTSYEWLVVAGTKAQYKGFGTINGAGNYRFMLTAIDGQINGKDNADKFRIKIWANNGGLVYDNQMNSPDTDDPTTVIGGGNIIIHK